MKFSEARLGIARQAKPLLRTISSAALLAASVLVPISASGQTTYKYDALGRLLQMDNGSTTETTYSYDKAGNRTSGATVNFSMLQAWEQEEIPYHLIGAAEADGWSTAASTSAGALSFGPYDAGTPVGANVAAWRLMIGGEAVASDQAIATLDVFDASAGLVLAQRTLRRSEWSQSQKYEYFTLPFSWTNAQQGHAIELRVVYAPSTYLRADRFGLSVPILRGAQAGVATTSWEGETIYHQVGALDGDGWAGDTNTPAGALTYGPYVSVSAGQRVALWTLMVGNNAVADDTVVRLEVFDAIAGDVVTFRSLTPKAWKQAMQYETFGVPFTVDASRDGHVFEFRTIFRPRAYVRVDKIGLR